MKDEELIRKLLSGNQGEVNNGLKYIYKDMEGIANNIVLKNSGNKDDATEVLQEGVIAFYKNLVQEKRIMIRNNLIVNKNNDIVKISSYMYSIFRNIWFVKIRDQKKIINVDITNYNISYNDEDVYRQKTEVEIKLETYKRALEKMKGRCKEILDMFWVKRMRYKEIAQKLGHSNEKTSKQIKARCQKELKKILNVT